MFVSTIFSSLEKAAIEKAEQDKIRDRKRAERKVEKERRKKEYEDAQAAKKSTMEKDSDLENAGEFSIISSAVIPQIPYSFSTIVFPLLHRRLYMI